MRRLPARLRRNWSLSWSLGLTEVEVATCAATAVVVPVLQPRQIADDL